MLLQPKHRLWVQNYTRDPCGIVHLVIGDGGNIEGLCKSNLPMHITPSTDGQCSWPVHWTALNIVQPSQLLSPSGADRLVIEDHTARATARHMGPVCMP